MSRCPHGALQADAVVAVAGGGGEKYACACLKRCACTAAGTCWCARDGDRRPAGDASDAFFARAKFGGNKSDNAGSCACSCGGVLGV